MKQLLVLIPDEMAKELNKYPNKSEVVREAIAIYNEHISTDTINKMRLVFSKQAAEMNELTEKIEVLNKRLDEMRYT